MSADPLEGRERARQEFEKLVVSKTGARSLLQALPGIYADPMLQAAWEGWQARAEQERWISVEERLPEDGRLVLLSYGCGLVYCGRYDEAIKAWHLPRGTQTPVTHWQLMPAPPVHKGDS